MSGKAKNKGSFHYDSHTNMVMTAEDEIDEQAKHKVARVLEVVPSASKDEIILVLQHFTYDVDSTVNAFMENGAADILKHWRPCKTGTKPNMKPKKKKNKKKKGPVATVDSASIGEETENSSGNSHNNVCDDEPAPSQEETLECNREETRITDFPEEARIEPQECVPLLPKEVDDVVKSQAEATQLSSTCSSPQSEAAKYVSRESSRTASFSEDTSRHSTPLSSTSSHPAGQGKQNLEKTTKDLSRQTVCLQRTHNILEEELENSFKRIKTAIAEAHKLLEERNKQLEEEMEKVKKDARQLLKQRQDLAADLKRRLERGPSMTDAERNDLRLDIKHFVVERKLDEELGKTMRFMWEKDRITQEIQAFGEITHVKNCYSQRRQSTLSVASSSNLVVPVLDEPVDIQVLESPVDSVETSAIEETVEQRDTRQQGGNRNRTFYPSGYHYGYNNTRPNTRPFHQGEGRTGGRGRGWGGPRPMGRREDGHWNQQQPYQKHPYQQRVNNSNETPEEERVRPAWEHRGPYRGSRFRNRGYFPRHYNNYRPRNPSKDLQLNGEIPRADDNSSTNIANGFVAH